LERHTAEGIGNAAAAGAEAFNHLMIPGYSAWASGGDVTEVISSAGLDVILIITGGKVARVARNSTKFVFSEGKFLYKTTPQVIEREVVRPLLQGEGRVGTYRELLKQNPKKSGLAGHHMPSASYMEKRGITRKEAIAMNVEHPTESIIPSGRHQQTRTFGGKSKVDSELAPRDELAADIHDMRKIYQNGVVYDKDIKDGLLEVIKRNQIEFPKIFAKRVKK
jgi:hypothetical protein